jgi:hypothetical protein
MVKIETILRKIKISYLSGVLTTRLVIISKVGGRSIHHSCRRDNRLWHRRLPWLASPHWRHLLLHRWRRSGHGLIFGPDPRGSSISINGATNDMIAQPFAFHATENRCGDEREQTCGRGWGRLDQRELTSDDLRLRGVHGSARMPRQCRRESGGDLGTVARKREKQELIFPSRQSHRGNGAVWFGHETLVSMG